MNAYIDNVVTEATTSEADFDWDDWTIAQQDNGSVFDAADDTWG